MCTVTIHRDDDRILVTMNRDEARGRADEVPPRLEAQPGCPDWLAPADGEKGGTWFGVNDRGMVAALLNAYVPGDLALYGREDVPSRGGIIPQLLALEPEQALAWLHRDFDPSLFPSFTLVVVTPSHAESYAWRLDGSVTTRPIDTGWSMITSSLWRTEDVIPWRHQRFRQWTEDGSPEYDGVPAFNLLEVPGKLEWSPFTTRSFSMTRSITQAQVIRDPLKINLRYWLRHDENAIDPRQPTSSQVVA